MVSIKKMNILFSEYSSYTYISIQNLTFIKTLSLTNWDNITFDGFLID